jgi:hypothetical protein
MRKLKHTSYLFASMALLGFALVQPQQANAQGNPYPVDPIQTLDPGAMCIACYTNYTVDFTAAALTTTTDITFAFRDDPGFIGFDSASVVDITNVSANLLTNGGFEDGNLTGWNYDNVYGATFGGVVTAPAGSFCPNIGTQAGSFLWCDGAVGSYDAIDQTINTTAGDTYQISYYAGVDGSTANDTDYQEFCTNGADAAGPTTLCNGIDLAVYAQSTIPASGNAPEPASMLLFGTGLAGLGILSRRRAKKQ